MPGVKLEDITEIYSHQQAIGQCSRFLSSLSGVRVIPCGNTAEAAKLVAESGSRHAAAISSHPCAALYGLECVSDKIQDSENNYTRFFCVAKDPVIYAGANRISLILSFENKPGALYEILSKLAALDINMTKLESCPVAGSDFEFVFFLELEASVQDPECACHARGNGAQLRGVCIPRKLRRGVNDGGEGLRTSGTKARSQLVGAHSRRARLCGLSSHRAGAGGAGRVPRAGRTSAG